MSVPPEVAGCGGCGASVRVNWMREAIRSGCFFSVVAREKCCLIRFAVAAESAEALAAGRARVRFAFGADSVALYAEDGRGRPVGAAPQPDPEPLDALFRAWLR